MNELELNFERLDKYIRSTINDESSVTEATEVWSSWINSNRQIEKITNVDQLLKLLERRGIYNQEEYNVFKVFKKIIHDPVFDDMVECHKILLKQHVSSNPRNVYGN